MPEASTNLSGGCDEAAKKSVLTLFEWAGVNEDEGWQKVSKDPEACEKIANELKAISALPIVQAEDANVPFVHGHHVVNIRPLVVPVLVAAVVRVAVTVNPSLESAILPWLDLVGLLDRVGKIYRNLDDDEVDVFGAVSALYTDYMRAPSVTDPSLYPAAEGVRNWFASRGFEPPPHCDTILDALKKKGAILTKGNLYIPSFFGSND